MVCQLSSSQSKFAWLLLFFLCNAYQMRGCQTNNHSSYSPQIQL
uniref:Uncharacterized protein n=1 Tax=Rhizophora mucronata TaxID=61149 RepID=A0A2P2QDC4_RHIMU